MTNKENESEVWGEDKVVRTEDGIAIEFLQNAQFNISTVAKTVNHPILKMALEQLHNGLGKHSMKSDL